MTEKIEGLPTQGQETYIAELKRRASSIVGSERAQDLVNAYSQKHRAYHNCQHILETLTVLGPLKRAHPYELAINLSVLYHDVVYETDISVYGANEENSALYLSSLYPSWSQEIEQVQIACAIIRATKSHCLDNVELFSNSRVREAAQWVLDADLSILAAEKHRLYDYDKAIAKEFGVDDYNNPPMDFAKGRLQALEGLYRVKHIFISSHFMTLEAKARANLQELINVWKEKIECHNSISLKNKFF